MIKVDRSFVAGVGAEDEDTAIVDAIVEIGRLGLGGRGRGRRARGPGSRACATSAATPCRATSSRGLCAAAFASFLADEEPDAQAAVAAL